MDDRSYEERLARWRGGIDARLGAAEETVKELLVSVKSIDKTTTQMGGDIASLRREVGECRDDARKLAEQIAEEKEDAVRKLESAFTAKLAQGHAWRLSKFQAFVGGGIVALTSALVALIQLAVNGQFG